MELYFVIFMLSVNLVVGAQLTSPVNNRNEKNEELVLQPSVMFKGFLKSPLAMDSSPQNVKMISQFAQKLPITRVKQRDSWRSRQWPYRTGGGRGCVGSRRNTERCRSRNGNTNRRSQGQGRSECQQCDFLVLYERNKCCRDKGLCC